MEKIHSIVSFKSSILKPIIKARHLLKIYYLKSSRHINQICEYFPIQGVNKKRIIAINQAPFTFSPITEKKTIKNPPPFYLFLLI